MMDEALHQFKADPELQKQYDRWLESPMTKMVIRILETINRPRMPFSTEAMPHALSHATQCGAFNTIIQMQTLTDLVKESEEIETTYGAEETLKAWNRTSVPVVSKTGKGRKQ